MTVRDPSMSSGTGRALGILPDLGAVLVATLLRRIRHGKMTVIMPSGRRVAHAGAEAGPETTLVLHNLRALRRVMAGGASGFAEGYMAGDWSSPNLPLLVELLALNADQLGRLDSGSVLGRLLRRMTHRGNRNTHDGSRRNIAFHYDLGNDFYERWLDSGMQYSSAIRREGDESLEAAQLHKLDRINDLLALSGGQSVLEIGCGWGAVSERLAGGGADVTAVTLSAEQLAYAKARLASAGLAADLRLQDYRDVDGRFDRIVSIEMIEAVGEEYWPAYFQTLRDRLKPGGRAVIQAILIAEDRFDEYRRNPDFIQTYIFPGGMLLTRNAMRKEAEAAGLVLSHEELHGQSYAWTLAEWRSRFHAAWSAIEPMGFDARFRRMWDYYLAYCEGGFRAGMIDVGLYVLERPATA